MRAGGPVCRWEMLQLCTTSRNWLALGGAVPPVSTGLRGQGIRKKTRLIPQSVGSRTLHLQVTDAPVGARVLNLPVPAWLPQSKLWSVCPRAPHQPVFSIAAGTVGVTSHVQSALPSASFALPRAQTALSPILETGRPSQQCHSHRHVLVSGTV